MSNNWNIRKAIHEVKVVWGYRMIMYINSLMKVSSQGDHQARPIINKKVKKYTQFMKEKCVWISKDSLHSLFIRNIFTICTVMLAIQLLPYKTDHCFEGVFNWVSLCQSCFGYVITFLLPVALNKAK